MSFFSKYLTSGESIIELLMIAIADDSQFTFDAVSKTKVRGHINENALLK